MHGSEFWSEAGTILVEAAEQYFCISFPIFWEINLAVVKRKKTMYVRQCVYDQTIQS